MIKLEESPTLWQGLVRIVIGFTGLAGIAIGLEGAFLTSLSMEPAQTHCTSSLIVKVFWLLTLCIGLLMVAYAIRRSNGWRARLRVPLILLLLSWAHVCVLLPLLLQRRDYTKGAAIYSELLGFDARLLIAGVVLAYMLGSIMLTLRYRALEWSLKSHRKLVIGIVTSVAFLPMLGIVIGYQIVPLVAELFRNFGTDLPELTTAVIGAYSAPYVLLLPCGLLLGLAIALLPLIRRKHDPKCYKFVCERLAGISFVVGLGLGLSVLGLWSPLFYLCAQQCQPEGRYTQLHAAAMLGRVDSVRRLLNAGTEVDAWDDDRRTPLMSALAGLGNLQRRTRRGDSDENGLYTRANHQEVMELLLSYGASVDNVTGNGRTALHHAAQYGIPEAVDFLIRGDAFASAKDKDGWTPLHFAARAGSQRAVEILLASDIDVDAKDTEGRTPLHIAAGTDEVAVAKVLLAYGAMVNIRDNKGSTPLREAMNWSRYHDSEDELARSNTLVHALLSAGAQSELTNAAGQTPRE
jgi:hypothetical protein